MLIVPGKTSRSEVKLVQEDDSKVVDVKVKKVEDYLIEDQVLFWFIIRDPWFSCTASSLC